MKRSLLFAPRSLALLTTGTGLIAATYGLVRLAYGLFLPDVQAELAMSDGTAGLIASGTSLAYCLAAAISLATAHRPRLLVIAAAVTAGGGALGMAAAPGVATFAVLAVVSSAGAGFASPALVAIVRRNLAAAAHGRAQAIVNAGTGPGLVGAGLLALVLLPQWRVAWAVAAVFTVVVAGAVLVLDRDGSGGPLERATLPPRSWYTDHVLVIASTLLLGAASAAVWTYGRTVLVEAGMADRTTVAAWIAIGLGGAAVVSTARWVSGLQPTTAWVVTTLTVAGATAALGAVPSHFVLAMLACMLFGWGFVAATGALIAWTTRIDEQRAAAGTSLLFVVLVLGQAGGSSLSGLLIEARGAALTFAVAGLLALGAGCLPLVRSGRKRRTSVRSRRVPATSGRRG